MKVNACRELWKGEGIIQQVMHGSSCACMCRYVNGTCFVTLYSWVSMMKCGEGYEMGGSDRSRTRASPVISKKPRRVSGRCSDAGGGVGRKIRALQELVPNGEAMEVEGLFREAANYIVCLQVQVQVMQMMLGELSPEEDS